MDDVPHNVAGAPRTLIERTGRQKSAA